MAMSGRNVRVHLDGGPGGEEDWEADELTDELDLVSFEEPPRPILDMNHGFMSQIIRNQVDRDQYDKDMKERAAADEVEPSPQPAPIPRNSKRPPPKLYVPPHRKDVKAASTRVVVNSSAQQRPAQRRVVKAKKVMKRQTEPSAAQVPLLNLELEDSQGNLHRFSITRDDDAIRTTKIIAQKLGLTDQQAAKLRQKLEIELGL